MNTDLKTAFFITNGNMGGTAGDATLVLRRARAMYDEKGIYTKILLLNPVEQGKVNQGDFFYSIEECNNKKELRQRILQEKPQWLILYGDRIQLMTSSLRRLVKKHQIETKIVVDIQGAVEEKKEYSNSFIRKNVVYPISKLTFENAVRNADAAFVVSDEIQNKCEKALKSKIKNLEYYKVRCGFDMLASVEEIKKNRNDFRAEKNISDDTKVFCYSGYRAGWQKVDEIIEHFCKYDRFCENCFFAFFCNTDEEFETLLREKFPRGNYYVGLLHPEDYFKSLCGCDVGYILRDYNETNRVAFPNKFSDYLSSGLIIALNDALPEPMRLIKQLPSHYIDTNTVISDMEDLFDKLDNRLANYDDFVKAALTLGEEELLYSAQIQKITF